MGNCDNFDIIVREVGSENENGEVDDRVGLLVVRELSTIQAHFYADKYCFLFFYFIIIILWRETSPCYLSGISVCQ